MAFQCACACEGSQGALHLGSRTLPNPVLILQCCGGVPEIRIFWVAMSPIYCGHW